MNTMTRQHRRSKGAIALGAVFLGASVIQLTNRRLFTALVPKQLHQYGNQVQGVMTGALAGIGTSFIVPKLQPVARWAATLMLTASLPAAVDQVRHPEETDALHLPRRLVIARIPAQVLVIALSWVVTRKR